MDVDLEEILAEEVATSMTEDEMTVKDDLSTYDIVHWDSIIQELITVPQDEKTVYWAFSHEHKAAQQ